MVWRYRLKWVAWLFGLIVWIFWATIFIVDGSSLEPVMIFGLLFMPFGLYLFFRELQDEKDKLILRTTVFSGARNTVPFAQQVNNTIWLFYFWIRRWFLDETTEEQVKQLIKRLNLSNVAKEEAIKTAHRLVSMASADWVFEHHSCTARLIRASKNKGTRLMASYCLWRIGVKKERFVMVGMLYLHKNEAPLARKLLIEMGETQVTDTWQDVINAYNWQPRVDKVMSEKGFLSLKDVVCQILESVPPDPDALSVVLEINRLLP